MTLLRTIELRVTVEYTSPDTGEKLNPFNGIVPKIYSDAAGSLVEEMAILEKCSFISSGVNPWRASMGLGINPRIRNFFQKLFTLSRVSLILSCM